MEKFNFLKKTKDVVKVAGIVTLSSLPNNIEKNKVPENIIYDDKKIEVSEDTRDIKEKSEELDTDIYNEYVRKTNTEDKKRYDFETFIPEKRITETMESLRDKIVEQIPEQISQHYKSRFNRYEKIYTHDHEILALGNNENFNVEDYIELMAKTGDSLYFYQKPVISFEGYLLNDNLKLFSEEEMEKAEKKMKEEYDSLKKEQSQKVSGIDYESFAKDRRNWLTKENFNNWQNDYNDYVEKNNHSETRELHTGSTIYAFLRSGAYENFVSQGRDKEKLIKNMIHDLSNPKYYQYDSLANENIPKGKYFSERYEVAWILSTWLELEKRGINLDVYFGDKDSAETEPISIEKLVAINKEQLDYTLDTTDYKEKFNLQKDSRSFPMNSGSACEGSHALHALAMYDLYKKDTLSLASHLNLAKEMLEKTLSESEEILKGNFKENQKKYQDITHDLSHELLSFTELPENFVLDPELKKVVQNSISRMIEFTKIIQGQEKMSISDMSHILDVLDHLPKSVLQK